MNFIRNYLNRRKCDDKEKQSKNAGGKIEMPGIYTEKEIYGDALTAQKGCTNQYNLAANECSHEDIRQTMMKILNQEHEIQKSVFDSMHAAGFYPTPAAEEKKVQETKQKFSQSAK